MSIAEVTNDSKENPHSSTNPLPQLGPIACSSCGVIDVPTVTRGTGPHAYRANCRHCTKFVRWVSQYTHEERVHRREQARLRAMRNKPPSGMQFAYLKSLGHTGPEPVSMAEASQRIEILKRGRVI